MSMEFDFTGAQLFLAYRDGQVPLSEVLDHPAYRIVREHARLFANGISEQDVESALCGEPSPYYGLDHLSERLARLNAFLDLLRSQTEDWLTIIQSTLSSLFPSEPLNISIYPIIGYDMGIGLHEAVCMNCNYEPYLDDPAEFLFYIIHECTHVIYERHHHIPPLSEIQSASQWRSYFNLWLQNEGYAVYTPLHLRQASNHLSERDYRVLFDADQLELHRVALLESLQQLETDPALSHEQYLEICFGPRRLTYRLGCECIRRIEREAGPTAVQEAFYLDGDTFVNRYIHLLK